MEILKGIGTFLQDQVLGMKWLNEVIGNMLSLFGLDVTSRIGGSVLFFLYDVTKITILLCFLIFLISYIQSYFPPERSKKIMARFHGVWANIIAALLFLFLYSAFYWLYKCRVTTWRNILVFNFFPYGRPWLSRTFDEYFRLAGCSFVRYFGLSYCSSRRYTD